MRVFLDSGAFSVWNRGESINLDDYIKFCKRYQDDLDAIATLDVIPGKPNQKLTELQRDNAAWEGWANYQKMLKAKINPEKLLHTFHQGDHLWVLERLIEEGAPYIGVSPANDRTSTQREKWLQTEVFPILLNSKGKPKAKFHGFAVTSLKLALNYPWYSVDSSSWRLRGGGYGLLDLPVDPYHPERLESCYVNSIPIGTGVGKHMKNDEIRGMFDVQKMTQSEVSFSSPKYKKAIIELLAKYNFTLKELEESAYLRAAWNAIYLMTTVKKFSNVILYLAANDVKSLEILMCKMKENKMSTKDLNVLISFAFISQKNPDKINNLDKLINLKYNNE
jgi:hypothetical protein